MSLLYYVTYLEQRLTPPRFQHSLGVMEQMQALAVRYALDCEQASLAGLLHDVAKDLSAEAQLAIADQAGVTFNHTCERHPMYLHGPVGAFLARETLGVHDEVVLRAIATHTAHAAVPQADERFCWCLRFADLLAPVKSWHGQRRLHETVHAGHFEQARWLLTVWVREYMHSARIPVHPNFDRNLATFSQTLSSEMADAERW